MDLQKHTTISDELDRLEVLVGRIGFNSPKQARDLLNGLDGVALRLEEWGDTPSRRNTQVHFDALLARLRKDAAQFVRDLGGANVLAEMRAGANPPRSAEWWYLDELLAARRKAAIRRAGFTLAGIVLALVLLGVIYEAFIAPPPEVTARYRLEQSARDSMLNQDWQAALGEVDSALQYAPEDPTLHVIRGVIFENMGQEADAETSYSEAKKYLPDEVTFLLLRAQAYDNSGQPEAAMTDAQEAVRLDPQSAQGYLLIGGIHESNRRFRDAMAAYDQAFQAADAQGQTELAAIARTRTAMVMQIINQGVDLPTGTAEP